MLKVAPILLLPAILCTGLSSEKAVTARPEARIRTFVSFTIFLPNILGGKVELKILR